ncbi:MAG: Stf0 family sulfotransferase [Pseudomonadota bacterium]
MILQHKGYLLCTMPRSGSTLLCDLLEQTGVAGAPDSFFRWQSMADFASQWGIAAQTLECFDQAYLDTALKHGNAGTGCFGMRIMWNNMPPLCARLGALFPHATGDHDRLRAAFGRLRFLHLSRADKVAEAVSLAIAHQTGLWHRNADGSERERFQPHQDPVFDADLIMREYMEVTAGHNDWNDWFKTQGITPHRVRYEALSANPKEEVASILTFLGLNPAAADKARPKTRKLATALNRDWADRFRAAIGIENPQASA